MASVVSPYSHVAIRTPSGVHRILQVIPDAPISLGKYGSFNSNQILGRPFYLTYEIQGKTDDEPAPELRLVPPSELHIDALTDDTPTPSESRQDAVDGLDEQVDIEEEHGQVVMRDNRLTVDDPSRQTLRMEDIEELKKAASAGSGKDIVAKIMESHAALGEKTAFSLAKYILRKTKKYLKRFTVLPLDVNMLAQWMLYEREPLKIMELREETIGLIASWSNVHCSESPHTSQTDSQGRWLVVDDTAGLLVAALAERMGILHADPQDQHHNHDDTPPTNGTTHPEPKPHKGPPPDTLPASSNTITLVHSAAQPNISLLSYFSYEPHANTTPGPLAPEHHPLHTHLKTLSWLQLLSPTSDATYTEPTPLDAAALAALKSGKRGAYHRKRRRWQRTRAIVDDARAGHFDGLVCASLMHPTEVLHHLVPLLRGGAPVVVYSASAEPLVDTADAYSTARRTAFINALHGGDDDDDARVPSDDFPLDPRLLLAPSLHTVRAREWQVLPGRTHPLMTGRGAAEGYVLTGTRVLPTETRAEPRGRFVKKRKTAAATATGDGELEAIPGDGDVAVEDDA